MPEFTPGMWVTIAVYLAIAVIVVIHERRGQ
jgi:hypothetical protein